MSTVNRMLIVMAAIGASAVALGATGAAHTNTVNGDAAELKRESGKCPIKG